VDEASITAWLISARAVHFAACLIAMAVWTTDRIVVGSSPPVRIRWKPIALWLTVIALPLILISGLAWLALLATDMSGLPIANALRWENLRIVLDETHFGFVWKARFEIGIAASVAVTAALIYRWAAWGALICTASLSASLAWAGHGQSAPAPMLHVWSDALHLLAGGFWPGGLLPLALLWFSLLRSADSDWPAMATAVGRFSRMSVIAVAVLVASGAVNTWCLLGSLRNLLDSGYGRTLGLKIILVGAMVMIGSVNQRILLPRLRSETNRRAAAIWLQVDILMELLLGAAVIVVVARLGLLPPGRQ
jgi:copper resistance protein D